jgi:hypothetical protein
MAIEPVCFFDACSAHNYGRDLALHFFERVGFSMNPPRKWTTRFLSMLGAWRSSIPFTNAHLQTFTFLHLVHRHPRISRKTHADAANYQHQ